MAVPRTRRVLLVEDDPDVLGLLRQLCSGLGLLVEESLDAETAYVMGRERLPDLVVADVVLPGMDGIELTRRLKADARFGGIPVIVMSARRTTDTKVAAFNAGASDVIEKPFQLAELEARLSAALATREAFERLERTNWELRVANERLLELATTDELTGLCNARHFRERLAEEFGRAERYQTHLSLIMADLDGFKAVNDHHGHPAGDRLLSQVAQRLRQQGRATDIVARYGGDEFAFILPHTGLDDALVLAGRLAHKIGDAPLRLTDGKLAAVALSCGVASLLECPGLSSPWELLAAADAALYTAKRQGAGAVVAAATAAPLPAAAGASHTHEMPRGSDRYQSAVPVTPSGAA